MKLEFSRHIFEIVGLRSRYSDSLQFGRSGDRIPVEARFSATVQTGPGTHPASYTMGTGFFSGVKRPGRGVDHPPHLAPRLKKSRAITPLPLWAFVACYRVNFTFTFTKIFKFQVPYWEPTNIRRDRTKFSSPGDLVTGICTPLVCT